MHAVDHAMWRSSCRTIMKLFAYLPAMQDMYNRHPPKYEYITRPSINGYSSSSHSSSEISGRSSLSHLHIPESV